MADAHKNFASSLVATAPSPATSGTTLVVTTGDGTKFPTAPFNVTIWPTASNPSTGNAEIARCTAVSTDTLTIVRAQEGTSARTVVVGDQIVAGVTAKTLTDVEASTYPYSGVGGNSYESFPRLLASGAFAPSTGQLWMAAVVLPAGMTVGHISFNSTATTTMATPTHWWFGLWDSARVQLATTADQTSTLWAASTLKSLAVATIASGASSTFTTTYTGLHYVGVCQVAATMATVSTGPTAVTGLNNTAPSLGGLSSTGLTTPPAFPSTATSFTGASIIYWCNVAP